MDSLQEFSLACAAVVGATFFTNPIEVIKTRYQFQGELKAKGEYKVHYRNIFHAGYTIAKHDGILALQKGLAVSMYHQMVMNGIRLTFYQQAEKLGLTQKSDGSLSFPKSVFYGACAGACGALLGSPLFLIKTQLQTKASKAIAVGHQHSLTGLVSGLQVIYAKEGFKGLWRGAGAGTLRVGAGSATQLTSYNFLKELLKTNEYYKIDGIWNRVISSIVGGISVALVMTPFDIVTLRIYNQGISKDGKPLLYDGILDCSRKILKVEGFLGFYKGFFPMLIRIGPHTVLIFVLWEQLRDSASSHGWLKKHEGG